MLDIFLPPNCYIGLPVLIVGVSAAISHDQYGIDDMYVLRIIFIANLPAICKKFINRNLKIVTLSFLT